MLDSGGNLLLSEGKGDEEKVVRLGRLMSREVGMVDHFVSVVQLEKQGKRKRAKGAAGAAI